MPARRKVALLCRRVAARRDLSDATQQKRHVQDVTRDACAVVQRWIDDGKCNPVDPRLLFIMLWSTTQFNADFAPTAATTLEVPNLRKADFAKAAGPLIAMPSLLPPDRRRTNINPH